MKMFNKVLAIVLTIFTLVSALPMSVFADAWLDVDIPQWIRDAGTTGNSHQSENGTVTNVTVETDAENNSTTYTKTITSPDGTVSTEIVTYTKDSDGNITGYNTTTTKTTDNF